MDSFRVYLPIDRQQALAQWTTLPDRADGAALFADLSGFTALTEALAQEFGPQRGAEEISRELNRLFDALIDELHRFGGSVLTFSGDAITCWLEGENAAWRAVTCAFAMQAALQKLSAYRVPNGETYALGVKIAVVAGAVRRFVVGDPERQLLDVIAGATLDRLAEAEHYAERGDVVLDEATFNTLAEQVELGDWRTDNGQRFARLAGLRVPAPEAPWPPLADEALLPDQLRPWLLPAIYERLSRGQGEFLAELRPTAALFVNFSGIDYEDEVAGFKLDMFVRHLQTVFARFDGAPLQLTVGDKGSYVYAAFGAPVAHEDDAIRAVSAALELRATQAQFPEITQLRMGIAQGRTYTGAYGAELRRTYGVLGDSVNLAARLMQAAAPSQILVSRPIYRQGQTQFSFEELPAITVKGKAEVVAVFAVKEMIGRRARTPAEAQYALPMVGRAAELALLNEKFQLALQRRGQVVAITGEAGMGKSRLVAEAMRLAAEAGFRVVAGACESFGADISYLVWQDLLRALFEIDSSAPPAEQIAQLEARLRAINPAFVHRLPLLAVALNLPITDNDLTRTFDAKLRKTSLESLLVDCLRAWAKAGPLAIMLEDCHWIDALSLDLLEAFTQAAAGGPVLIGLVYRPQQEPASPWQKLRQRPFFTEIALKDFSATEAAELIQLKLQQVYGEKVLTNTALVDKFVRRAEGNPFYIEELLNYLRDRNIDPNDQATLAQLDLPASLHSLILSRIDQLTEEQKLTLKFASIIGRLFTAAALWGAYPQLGATEEVLSSLQRLSRLELTVVDSEPELTYLFRHIVTQEVAYESLPYATRAVLHRQIGRYIEDTAAAQAPEQYLDLLAYHFGRSDDEAKKRLYLLRAGEAAQATYANASAQNYYGQLLPLLEPTEKLPVIHKLAQVLELVGNWSEARTLYEQELTLAETHASAAAVARSQMAIAELVRKRGQYAEAQAWLEKARQGFEALHDQTGVGQVLHSAGTLAAQQGQYEAARTAYEQSLAIRRALDDKPQIGSLLSNLGIVARYLGDTAQARALHEEALTIRRAVGDRWAISVSLNNIGNLALDLQDYAAARASLEEAVSMMRVIGDKRVLATSLNNYANAVRNQKDFSAAFSLYRESLQMYRELGDRWGLAYLLEDMGIMAALDEKATRAFTLVGAASALRQAIGSPLSAAEQTKLEAALAPARTQLTPEAEHAATEAGRALNLDEALALAVS